MIIICFEIDNSVLVSIKLYIGCMYNIYVYGSGYLEP